MFFFVCMCVFSIYWFCCIKDNMFASLITLIDQGQMTDESFVKKHDPSLGRDLDMLLFDRTFRDPALDVLCGAVVLPGWLPQQRPLKASQRTERRSFWPEQSHWNKVLKKGGDCSSGWELHLNFVFDSSHAPRHTLWWFNIVEVAIYSECSHQKNVIFLVMLVYRGVCQFLMMVLELFKILRLFIRDAGTSSGIVNCACWRA